jgi:trans-aconitate 2-methyltransferase
MAHDWDAGHYLKFADVRTLPAIDLLSRIDLEAPAAVVDLAAAPATAPCPCVRAGQPRR